MKIEYPDLGICGLSCKLCPRYNTDAPSRCHGCKTESRMDAGCGFIACALNKKGVEFCWDCGENTACEKWARHIKLGESCDSFKCYRTLKKDIEFIKTRGLEAFNTDQNIRKDLLDVMLREFDDMRSKNYYCVAATVMDINDLRSALRKAHDGSKGLDRKEKARLLHRELDDIANKKNISLVLRK